MHLHDLPARYVANVPDAVAGLFSLCDGPGHLHRPSHLGGLDFICLPRGQFRVGAVQRLGRSSFVGAFRNHGRNHPRPGSSLGEDPQTAYAVPPTPYQNASVVVTEELHRYGGIGVLGPDQNVRRSVVAENQVHLRPVDGGFDALRVAGEVKAVGLVGDVLVPAPEHRVVERGGELADTTAHSVDQLSPQQGARLHESVLLGPLSHMTVEAEGLAGWHQGVIDPVGEELDVGHPGCTAIVVGRVLRHQVADSQILDVFGGHVGLGALDLGQQPLALAARGESLQQVARRLHVDTDPRRRRVDYHPVVLVDLVVGVDRGCSHPIVYSRHLAGHQPSVDVQTHGR